MEHCILELRLWIEERLRETKMNLAFFQYFQRIAGDECIS